MTHATHCFLAAVAIKFGRASVPVRNAVSAIPNKDGVIAQVEQPRSFRQSLLTLLSLRNVPRASRRANHPASSVLDRRNRKGKIDLGSIFAPADSLEMIDSLASADPLNDWRFFAPPIPGNAHSKR